MDFLFRQSEKNTDKCIGTIYARIRKKGINKKYSTGYRITAEEWDNYRLHKYQSKVMMPSIGITYDQFVQILEKIKHYFGKSFDEKNIKESMRNIKTEVLHGTKEIADMKRKRGAFLDSYIKQYYDDLISGKRLKTGRGVKVKEETAGNFRALYNKLLKYQRSTYRHYRMEDIDMEWQREFVAWLSKKGHFPNGIHVFLKQLHLVMRCAYDEQLTDNDITRFTSFVPKAVPTDDIFLTPEQIDTLYNLDLSSREKITSLIEKNVKGEKRRENFIDQLTPHKVASISNTLDIFLIGCFTGQRISDYSRINKGMITRLGDDWFIRIVQKKTGKKVYIPLDERVKNILDKHKGTLPTVSLTNLNINLGLIFEYLGWTQDSGIDKSRMGKKRGRRVCDMVSSHTARRSFATNAYSAGIKVSSIMAVTGHSTERVFRRYIKLFSEDKAMLAAEDFAGIMDLD